MAGWHGQRGGEEMFERSCWATAAAVFLSWVTEGVVARVHYDYDGRRNRDGGRDNAPGSFWLVRVADLTGRLSG